MVAFICSMMQRVCSARSAPTITDLAIGEAGGLPRPGDGDGLFLAGGPAAHEGAGFELPDRVGDGVRVANIQDAADIREAPGDAAHRAIGARGADNLSIIDVVAAP